MEPYSEEDVRATVRAFFAQALGSLPFADDTKLSTLIFCDSLSSAELYVQLTPLFPGVTFPRTLVETLGGESVNSLVMKVRAGSPTNLAVAGAKQPGDGGQPALVTDRVLARQGGEA